MSECNFCTWAKLRQQGCRKATREERKLLWNAKKDFQTAFGDGVVIVDHNGKFVAWLMELPTHCCC